MFLFPRKIFIPLWGFKKKNGDNFSSKNVSPSVPFEI